VDNGWTEVNLNEGGFADNEVYVVAGKSLYYYYRPDSPSFNIMADTPAQTSLYRKYSGDNSRIVIVQPNSAEDQSAASRVYGMLNYSSIAPSWNTLNQYR
jgi:hypothetical protein